ncbi:MAG: NUDIX domain-containing protein [Alphaproteobacteria bacterium]
MADSLLDIVNDNDEIIGQRLRSEIHRDGLLHREVHVWVLTPENEIIFQKRSATKDTFPNLLTSTAGGHVEQGQAYLNAALAELDEECGIVAKPEDLIKLIKINRRSPDPVTQTINHPFRVSYLYRPKKTLQQLRVEKQDGEGFVALPFSSLQSNVSLFVPSLRDHHYAPMWDKIKELA